MRYRWDTDTEWVDGRSGYLYGWMGALLGRGAGSKVRLKNGRLKWDVATCRGDFHRSRGARLGDVVNFQVPGSTPLKTKVSRIEKLGNLFEGVGEREVILIREP